MNRLQLTFRIYDDIFDNGVNLPARDPYLASLKALIEQEYPLYDVIVQTTTSTRGSWIEVDGATPEMVNEIHAKCEELDGGLWQMLTIGKSL